MQFITSVIVFLSSNQTDSILFSCSRDRSRDRKIYSGLAGITSGTKCQKLTATGILENVIYYILLYIYNMVTFYTIIVL
jgi:hypothetical protein